MESSFLNLLYRYFFFSWLFMDVNVKDIYARAAAARHNKSQAQWLPSYIKRYFVCAAILFAIGYLLERSFPIASAFFFVPGVLMMPMSTVAGLAWFGLRHWH